MFTGDISCVVKFALKKHTHCYASSYFVIFITHIRFKFPPTRLCPSVDPETGSLSLVLTIYTSVLKAFSSPLRPHRTVVERFVDVMRLPPPTLGELASACYDDCFVLCVYLITCWLDGFTTALLAGCD